LYYCTDALKAFQKSIELNPLKPFVWFEMAKLYMKISNTTCARQCLVRMNSLLVNDCYAYYENLKHLQKEFELRIQQLESSSQESKDPDVVFSKFVLLTISNRKYFMTTMSQWVDSFSLTCYCCFCFCLWYCFIETSKLKNLNENGYKVNHQFLKSSTKLTTSKKKIRRHYNRSFFNKHTTNKFCFLPIQIVFILFITYKSDFLHQNFLFLIFEFEYVQKNELLKK
jgi:hypothetical protein